MKKRLLKACLFLLLIFPAKLFAQLYVTEQFQNTTVKRNVVFGRNWSVLQYVFGGPIFMDTLKADVYEPVGDVNTARPTVILLHPGSAIPIFYNYWCTGIKTDSAVVEMCKQFARRGYTAISINYRQGWNPQSTDQDVRTGGLLEALGRAVQDVKAAIRYFRNDAQTVNEYNIDPNMFILGGLSTGGTIAINAATLHDYSQIQMIKFLSFADNALYHFHSGTTYFDSTYWGNFDGYGGDPTLNYSGNTPGVSNAIQFAFSLQGAIGDSSWLHAGEIPMVAFHNLNDQNAPYYCGGIYSIGQFVVDVCGGHTIIQNSNAFQNNIQFQNATWTDPFSLAANQRNNGLDGLFPFSTATPHGAPWEWWDSTTCFQIMMAPTSAGGLGFGSTQANTVWFNSIADNPEMANGGALASALGHAYIDTVMGYLPPRIFSVITGLKDVSQTKNTISIYPNPAEDYCTVSMTDHSIPIRTINLYDVAGKLVQSFERINAYSYAIKTKSLDAGVYVMKVGFDKGEEVRKIVIQ